MVLLVRVRSGDERLTAKHFKKKWRKVSILTRLNFKFKVRVDDNGDFILSFRHIVLDAVAPSLDKYDGSPRIQARAYELEFLDNLKKDLENFRDTEIIRYRTS